MRVNFNLDLYRSKVEENRSSAKFVQFLEPSPPSRSIYIYIYIGDTCPCDKREVKRVIETKLLGVGSLSHKLSNEGKDGWISSAADSPLPTRNGNGDG